jgi:hypothetical protein
MKKINFYKSHYLLLTLLLAGLLMITFPSCSRKMTFETSRVVPAATGSVTIKKSKNNNYLVNVKTLHLAKPQNLTPPKDVYVVWMRTADNSLKNIGMIKSSSGLLSSTLKGELKATATSKPTSFFITAENDGNVQYPGDEVVLRTK